MTPNPKPQTIRLKGKAYTEFRKQICKRAGGQCEIILDDGERCGRFAPLYDANGNFDEHYCGHVSHKRSTGAGGEDTPENVEWSCPYCHFKHHGPQWNK